MKRRNKGLFVVAIYKWLQGLLLLALGIGLLRFLHRDISDVIGNVIAQLRIDPDNKLIDRILTKASSVDSKQVAQLSAVTIAFSVLFLTEGTGLFFAQRWAEYLTLIATASLVPVEIYELVQQPSVMKGIVLAINLIIVTFLFVIVRQRKKN